MQGAELEELDLKGSELDEAEELEGAGYRCCTAHLLTFCSVATLCSSCSLTVFPDGENCIKAPKN